MSSSSSSTGTTNNNNNNNYNKVILLIVIAFITFTIFTFSSSAPSNNNNSKLMTGSSGTTDADDQSGIITSPPSSNRDDDNFNNNGAPAPPRSKDNKKSNNNQPTMTISPLIPKYHDELFNMSQNNDFAEGKKIPPFLVRPAKRGNDLKIRWKCFPRKIGPFHVDAPSTPWPTCRMLDHDTEMRTFQFLTERLMCGLPVFGSQSKSWISSVKTQQQEKPSISFNDLLNTFNRMRLNQQDAIDDDASLKSHRPLRVLQVGANTGSNMNDPLVRILMEGLAQAVLLEPVPWIFEKLHSTYASMAGMISLVQAAVSNQDGSTTFMAPKPSMQAKGPWLHQMGGLNLPPRSFNRLKRMGLLKEFKKITVASLTVTTVLNRFAPWVDKSPDSQVGLPAPPDVVVIDAEGFDAVIVNQILDYVTLLDEAGRTNEDGETVSIIQYENKHVPKRDNARLMDRLVKMGYSVTEVYVDTVAVRTGRGAFYYNDETKKSAGAGFEQLEKVWPACDHGFTVERR